MYTFMKLVFDALLSRFVKFECLTLNVSIYIIATGGILETIKDVTDKVVDTFKPNEVVDSEEKEKEKLKTESRWR